MAIDLDEIPEELWKYVTRLRRDVARYRTERNASREDVDVLLWLYAELEERLAQ